MANGFYKSSSGELKEIALMFYPHLKNAHAKAVREGDPQGVAAEMRARLDVLEAEWAAEHPDEAPR